MHYKDQQNNLHALDSVEYEHLLPAGCVQITDEEAAEITASKIIPPTYKEQRAAAYPSLAEQLSAMWKGGEEQSAMLKIILEVKARYPKA